MKKLKIFDIYDKSPTNLDVCILPSFCDLCCEKAWILQIQGSATEETAILIAKHIDKTGLSLCLSCIVEAFEELGESEFIKKDRKWLDA